VKTNTWEFEAVWGHRPKGYGLWCFVVDGFDDKGQHQAERYFENGTVMDAKKKACHQFKAAFNVKRIETVKVMP